MSDTIQELIRLSNDLGREERQLAILGEGNTSADLGDGTFLVKASGTSLGTLTPNGCAGGGGSRRSPSGVVVASCLVRPAGTRGAGFPMVANRLAMIASVRAARSLPGAHAARSTMLPAWSLSTQHPRRRSRWVSRVPTTTACVKCRRPRIRAVAIARPSRVTPTVDATRRGVTTSATP